LHPKIEIWRPENKNLVRCDYEDGRFTSPWDDDIVKGFSKVLKWTMERRIERIAFDPDPKKEFLDAIKSIPVDFSKLLNTQKPHFTWLGHAACYLQTEGLYLVTDPVFSERASPFKYTGPERYITSPIQPDDIKIDVVLLSHTHYDHLDLESAKAIGNKALW
jgi:N-acyl-phosphatidylethanolamine-hydrolysing phospholipase D